MNRRETVNALIALGVAAVPFASLAQQKQKTWRIGIVWGGTGGAPEQAFLAGMKDHGYEVGRNLILDSRYAKGDPARYASLVDEVIALRPDVLMGTNTGVAIEMKKRTSTIPIVLGTPGDPIGSGLVQSLARPGGNVTGMSLQIHELSAKHIQLLSEVLPRMQRVAVLSDQSNEKSITEQYERIARTAADAKGMSLSVHRVDSAAEIRQAFNDLEARRADALLINPSPRFNVLRREIIRSAAGIRLPSIGFSDEWAQEGALVSFGPDFVEANRRTAYYVDRILKGTKPGDLPIEQPTKFFLAINARAAKELGIKIPSSVLVRADRVIE
jgi:putative ABC transport system substrate-binding protein